MFLIGISTHGRHEARLDTQDHIPNQNPYRNKIGKRLQATDHIGRLLKEPHYLQLLLCTNSNLPGAAALICQHVAAQPPVHLECLYLRHARHEYKNGARSD